MWYIGGLSIRPIGVQVASILGIVEVPGFVLETAVHQSNYPHEPDGMDIVEVCRNRY